METRRYLPVKRFPEASGLEVGGRFAAAAFVALDRGTPVALVLVS